MLTRRHALSAVASAALVAPVAALTPRDTDAALVALYERYTAIDRIFCGADMPAGMDPLDFDRLQQVRYTESRAILATLCATPPSGPLGAACIALALIRDSEEGFNHPDFLRTWDGYSRPPAVFLSDRVTGPLWTIAEWGLRQSGRLPASA